MWTPKSLNSKQQAARLSSICRVRFDVSNGIPHCRIPVSQLPNPTIVIPSKAKLMVVMEILTLSFKSIEANLSRGTKRLDPYHVTAVN